MDTGSGGPASIFKCKIDITKQDMDPSYLNFVVSNN